MENPGSKRAIFYWLAAAAFLVAAIFDFREGQWLKGLSSVALSGSLALLAMHVRHQMRVMLWASWVLLSASLAAFVARFMDWSWLQ